MTFSSSIANVNLVNGSLKVSYTYVNANTGQETPTPVTFGLQYPSVTVQAGAASGTIVITSTVPVNFIPKDFTFSVTNGSFTEKITVRQLPPTYFTSERGNRSSERTSGNWQQGDPPQRNRYMYAITTLAPDGSQVWGFPPLDAYGNTVNSPEVAQMISPKFMMASQLGARSATLTYPVSRTNCSTYWEETTINGITKRYDDWRLPTEAEMKYIDDLQHNINNPQGVVMHGRYYWDAYSVNGAFRMKNPSDMQSTSSLAGNRCIRDIKD